MREDVMGIGSLWIPIIIVGLAGFLGVLLPLFLIWRGQIQILIQEQNDFYGKMRVCGEPESFLLDFIFSGHVKKAIGRTYKIMGQVFLVLEDDQLIFEQLERNLWSSNQSYLQYYDGLDGWLC